MSDDELYANLDNFVEMPKNGIPRKKHYWKTPPKLLEDLEKEFGSLDMDPCPFPRTIKYNGLKEEWGKVVYCNPPVGASILEWTRKAIAEYKKGKTVLFIQPCRWQFLELADAMGPCANGCEIRNLGRVRFLATEDRSVQPAPGPCGLWILRGMKEGIR